MAGGGRSADGVGGHRCHFFLHFLGIGTGFIACVLECILWVLAEMVDVMKLGVELCHG
jgi:hypothetical protein